MQTLSCILPTPDPYAGLICESKPSLIPLEHTQKSSFKSVQPFTSSLSTHIQNKKKRYSVCVINFMGPSSRYSRLSSKLKKGKLLNKVKLLGPDKLGTFMFYL